MISVFPPPKEYAIMASNKHPEVHYGFQSGETNGQSAGGANDGGGEDRPAALRGAAHRTAGHCGLQLVERSLPRRGQGGRGHRVPPKHRHGRQLQPRFGTRGGGRHLHRGPGQVQQKRAVRRPGHLQGADLLGPQHQYCPRSPLGQRTGDQRRGPVPDFRHRVRLYQGPAGRRRVL